MAKRAGSALFACDERIRVAIDELAFAEAELGPDSTEGLSRAIAAGRESLGEAFRLNRANHDAVRGTPDDMRARDARIVELCVSAVTALDEESTTLAHRLALARRAPEVIAGIQTDASLLRARIPQARDIVDQLAARYSSEALVEVAAEPAEAEQLLDFAEHSARVAERRRAAGQREQANLALEAATEAVRRAATLLDAVETFEVEALHAESRLAALVEQSRRALAGALEAPQSRGVADAIAGLRAALDGLPAAGVNTDPIACLTRLRAANEALDAAIEAVRERATQPVPPPEHVRHAIYDADQQLDLVRDTVGGHPGWVGPEALAQLARSERVRTDLGHYLGSSSAPITLTDEHHRAHVIAMAQHVASLASEALHLARRDIRAARLQDAGRRGGVPD
ncbi:hypothetical protein [Agromyces sp. NPDC058064]|uniref:hypothetical protein n=1 Tax=Agromyces sp. NPDC058064 TaxID=3346322 RepID=UPI0036D787D6